MPKRKSGSSMRPGASKKRRTSAYRKPVSVVPGYTRTGGSYGRYAGRGAEYKFFDTANSFTFDTTGEVPATGQLNLIPQGVTESTRVGRKCVLKSIQMKGIVNSVPGAGGVGSTTAFMYLVLDKQANGAAAAVTDVLTGNLLTTAMRNLSNSQRFVVLKKWAWTLTAQAGVATAFAVTQRRFEFYKKCNIPLEFSSTTGAITELRSNNLFLLAGADNNSDDTIQMIGNTRVRFSDN